MVLTPGKRWPEPLLGDLTRLFVEVRENNEGKKMNNDNNNNDDNNNNVIKKVRGISVNDLARIAGLVPAALEGLSSEDTCGRVYERLLRAADELEKHVLKADVAAADRAAAAAYPLCRHLPFSGTLAAGEYARLLVLRAARSRSAGA